MPKARLEPFYTRAGIYLGDIPQAELEDGRLQRIFSRLVHGLYFDALGERIPDSYTVVGGRVFPWNVPAVMECLNRHQPNGPRVLGDVFSCIYVKALEDPFTTVWLLKFYDRVWFLVSTMPPNGEPSTECA